MKLDERIFKAYDIRGQYPDSLNEEIAEQIGRALVFTLKPKTVCVGHDMRTSSNALFEGLTRGITAQGADVIDIGLCSTDMLYFAVGHFGFDAGVMITASHNPGKDNGLKICGKHAVPIGEESGLFEIKQKVLSNSFPIGSKKGKVISKDVLADYATKCLSFISPQKLANLSIVVDAGNGMAGHTWPAVQHQINCKTIPLFFELDGTFPNHVPNPLLPENTAFLQHEVKRAKADIGLAFDGDADRVFLVDETGKPVSGSEVTALLAQYFLSTPEHAGAVILYDLRCSKIVPETIAASGGKPVMTRVGHSFIKQIMAKEKALFAGELSGHYYFRENFNADSGLIAALILLQLISEHRKPLSHILLPLRKKWFHSGEINFAVASKDEKIQSLRKKYGTAPQTLSLDGFTADFGNWWFNVRASNTEPLLRLNLEAKDPKTLQEKISELTQIFQSN